MLSRLRPILWPLIFLAIAAFIYQSRIRREMADFEVYRIAAHRALAGEPLYPAGDGHFRFKYLPAFALAMAPFALVDREAAKVIWFALSAGLLTAFVRWSVRALPERRRPEPVLLWLTVLFMAKFYAHELTLGQTNILLGVLLVGSLLAVQVDQPYVAGVLIGMAAFIKPYALLLLPWLGFSYGGLAALYALSVLVAGRVLPAIVYGWSGNVDQLVGWFTAVSSSTESTLLGADNVSIAAMWAKWIGAGSAATMLTAATSALLLAVAVRTFLGRRTLPFPEGLEGALLLTCIPLLSPQGWDYVFLVSTPAVVLLLNYEDRLPSLVRWPTLAALAVIGLTVYDLVGRTAYAAFMARSTITVCYFVVIAGMCAMRLRRIA